MRTKVITLTPDLAQRLISRSKTQRRLRQSVVDRLADDIENDRWHLTHQGIAVVGDARNGGVLQDGQHRCHAVLKSGKSVRIQCTEFDKDEDTGAVTWDDGLKRSVADVAEFAGVTGVTNVHAACARMMQVGICGGSSPSRSPTKQALLDFIDRHKAAISLAIQVKPGKGIHGICVGGVLGALGRAYYHVDRIYLERCITILRDGFAAEEAHPGDRTIQRLRNQLIADTSSKIGGGHAVRTKHYCWTEKAIRHAEAGEEMQIIRFVREELFPLPEEASPDS